MDVALSILDRIGAHLRGLGYDAALATPALLCIHEGGTPIATVVDGRVVLYSAPSFDGHTVGEAIPRRRATPRATGIEALTADLCADMTRRMEARTIYEHAMAARSAVTLS